MALISAVRDNDVLEMRRIMRGYGGRAIGDINQMDQFGNTALHWAVAQGFDDLVHLLIEAGARVNVVNEEDQSPLMRACRLGRVEAVDALLGAEALASATDRDGGTALMKAAYGGQVAIIEKLIERGAQHSLMDRFKMTALHHAARQGHGAAVQVLVRVGSVVDNRDGKDWTPLMHAADQGHAEAAEALLEMGANPLLVTEDTANIALDFAWDPNTRRALRLAMKRAKMAERAKAEAEQALQMAEMQAEYDKNQAAQAAINQMLKDEEFLAKLRASFDKFDKDGGGSIDVAEFGNACKEIGKEFADRDELVETMARFDQSGDGDISFSEFLDWWKEDAREAWKAQQKADEDASVRLETSVGQVLKG
jgi:Ca2+-binding EF-hand superfamily protein